MSANPGINEVHEHLGAAIAEAQLLERYLECLLAAAQGSGPESSRVGRPPQGLGQLISAARKALRLPRPWDDRLEVARGERNLLAHSLMSDRADALQTRSGRAELIRDLNQIGEELYQLWGYLDSAILTWLSRRRPTLGGLVEDLKRAVPDA